MNLVFNELSVSLSSLKDEYSICEVLTEFVTMLHENNANIENVFSEQVIYNFCINETFGIQDWMKKADVDQKRFLQSFWGRKVTLIQEGYYSNNVTFTYDSKSISAVCGSIAHAQNIPLLSVNSDKAWGGHEIIATHQDFQQITLRNIAQSSHFQNSSSVESDILRKGISSGQDLWERREMLYENLVFCETVKDQLYENPQLSHIQQVMKRLDILNSYYRTHTIFSNKTLGYDARSESDSVKKNNDLKAQRKFKLPDGTYEYFFDHISFSGIFCGRIHYLADDEKKKIYIGYIGKHLPTPKYKT